MNVVDFRNFRFAIADDSGKIVDNAQGYGYKTKKSASKAMWYRFGGGRQKMKSISDRSKHFFKQNPKIKEFINDLYEINFKEIARGEVSSGDILSCVNSEFNIKMPKEFLSA